MFSKATAPHWRPRDTGPLHVREGQITFDAEGVDYLTAVEPFKQPENMRNFSRVLHCPDKYSGVTIGRGYDMKERSTGEIMTHIRQSGIEEYKAVICSKAAGLFGRHAKNFISAYGSLAGEITHLQQIRLFEVSYREKREYARGVYSRRSTRTANALKWEHIDSKIRETFVDIVYQGIPGLDPLINLIASGGSRNDIIKSIENDPRQRNYPERLRARVRNLR
ncbi:peptidoglycan-binding protein [Paramixta manurensis]|uniref:peptidoglycan-binding protein n=1 Tax=Paramixta manurensis TaxID=2740817 RepID=UPI0033971E6E